jgi:hypothetical protein
MTHLIVLTHNCEIDKSPDVLVSEFVLRAHTDAGQWGHLVANRMARGWVIPDARPEGYVNFRTLRTIPKDLLQSVLEKRVHSMTPDGRDVMVGMLYRFLRRSAPLTDYDKSKEDAL